MEYEFEVVGKVVGKERPRVNLNSGIVYTPNKTKEYEFYIQQSFKIKYPKHEQINGRVSVDIIAFLQIPKSTSKKMKEEMLNGNISPTKKPDLDNIAKSVLDAMNKFIIIDDNQVSKISIEKKYAEEEKLLIRIKEY